MNLITESPPTDLSNGFLARGSKPLTFLIVDDDAVNIMAMQRALNKMKIVNPVRIARDGQEALDILRGTDGQEPLNPPYLITLDINMPRMDGFEFLKEVREDPALRHLVVFVLTTSDMPRDVASAYAQNVAGYIVKEDLRDGLTAALSMINTYSRIVELPN